MHTWFFTGRYELTLPQFGLTGNHMRVVYMEKNTPKTKQRRQPHLDNIWLLQSTSKMDLATACQKHVELPQE